MLSSLHIENVALIKETTLMFGEGFTVLTGETGAGKSIVLDALSLLCGGRSDKELIRSGESYAFVEGCFEELDADTLNALDELDIHPDEDGALYLSRKVTADGRSSARIGDRQVPTARLRAAARLMVDIHGQQDTMKLADREKHLPLIDGYGDAQSLLAAYKECYVKYSGLCRRLAELKESAKDAAMRKEMLEYKLESLKKAKLREGEEEELLADRKRFKSAEKISSAAAEAYGELYGDSRSAAERIYGAMTALKRICDALPEGAELVARLDSVKCEIDDIADTLSSAAETDADTAAEMLDRTETRLEEIAALKRRFGTDFDGLLSARNMLVDELDAIEGGDALIADVSADAETAKRAMLTAAEALHARRKEAADELKDELSRCLKELDMPSVTVEAEFTPKEPAADGTDSVELLISANAGEAPKPLSKIASGGELARIMLAFKTAAATAFTSGTMVFDEIDTGISGKTAQRVGVSLKKLTAAGTQVFCVTHSAQVAALADTHLLARKSESAGRTLSAVKALDENGRIEELARIIGGINIGDGARNAAAELLAEARKL